MRSNLTQWKALQEAGYFEKHVHFKGYTTTGHETLPSIEFFTKLKSTDKVVIIGCGYGRETIQIAPHVKWVWGIDVTEGILQKALEVTRGQHIHNFTGVLAEDYENNLPEEVDLIYSVVTMQHLTRNLVYQYFHTLKEKLTPRGRMIIQFLDRLGKEDLDAELKVHEPSVSWKKSRLEELAALNHLNLEIRTVKIRDDILHYWCSFTRKN